MKTQKIYDGRKENFKVHILSATTGSYLYSFGRFWWRKGKKDVKKEMKSCQAYSPMPPHAARGHAPRYEGYHRCKGKGDQVLTCTCHMCTTNELSACFWVNTLMIAMGGNFFLIRVVRCFLAARTLYLLPKPLRQKYNGLTRQCQGSVRAHS